MGTTNISNSYHKVFPELLVVNDDNEVLMLNAIEDGTQYWWPPGAYWVNEKDCYLNNTQPDEWVRDTLKKQINASPKSIALSRVDFIDTNHAPVFIYKIVLDDAQQVKPGNNFLRAKYFKVSHLPSGIGRDKQHAAWLKNLINTLN